MEYFILNFLVIINGAQTSIASIGVQSKSKDYRLNAAKNKVEETLRKANPGSKVAITLSGKPKLVNEEVYKAVGIRI